MTVPTPSEPSSNAPKPRRRIRQFFVGCFGLVLFVFVLLLVCDLISPPSSTPTPTAVAAVQVTAASSPTPLRPTLTPTPTPSPVTSTPTPRPAPTPTSSQDAEQAYRRAVSGELDRLAKASQTFKGLTSAVTPSLLSDPTWRSMVKRELQVWRDVAHEAQGLTPPPSYAAFHQAYLLALTQLTHAADDYEAGIDQTDSNLVRTANQEVNSATALLDVALQQLPTPPTH